MVEVFRFLNLVTGFLARYFLKKLYIYTYILICICTTLLSDSANFNHLSHMYSIYVIIYTTEHHVPKYEGYKSIS